MEIQTPRLTLRQWRDSDYRQFADLNADPEVMRHFPSPLTQTESDAMIDRMKAAHAERGFGLMAAELRSTDDCIGFIGLSVPRWEAHFTPCVEVGWRLARAHWNQGLATEGATAVLSYAFDVLALAEVVSFTTKTNIASQRVMQKIGMHRDPVDDFEHPGIPVGHPLRPHVLFRKRAGD